MGTRPRNLIAWILSRLPRGIPVFKHQGIGGVIVINASKNGLSAGKDAIAYTTAKAAEIHMARCLAEEGVNTVFG